MSADVPAPRTVWERAPDEVASGAQVLLRAAVFQIGGEERSALVLGLGGKGESATVILNPDEAKGLAMWLREAADAALAAAPPMYRDE